MYLGKKSKSLHTCILLGGWVADVPCIFGVLTTENMEQVHS